jgi:hypothetical protein
MRTTTVLALAALLASGPAAADPVHGSATIDDVELAASAVRMGGERYLVTDATRIEDAVGAELTLAELPSLAGGASGDEAAAWFEAEASQAGRAASLTLLRLTGSLPK